MSKFLLNAPLYASFSDVIRCRLGILWSGLRDHPSPKLNLEVKLSKVFVNFNYEISSPVSQACNFSLHAWRSTVVKGECFTAAIATDMEVCKTSCREPEAWSGAEPHAVSMGRYIRVKCWMVSVDYLICLLSVSGKTQE